MPHAWPGANDMGNGQLQISRFSPNMADRYATSTTNLADVIRAVSEVDGNYSDVVDMLQSLKKSDSINARVLVGARPRPIWNFNREDPSSTDSQTESFEITNPIPELYFDRLAETEAETVKRNHTRADAVISGRTNESDQSDSFFDRVKSVIPGI